MSPNRTRCAELDAVRGISALAVLLFHYTVRYPALFGDGAPIGLDIGLLGVDVFFGVSGFVILMTLESCRNPADFVVARFLRLYPTYWVAVAATFTVMTLFPLAGRTATWPQALVNLTMLQEYVGVEHVDGVYWSLEVELVFYAWMLAAFAAGWLPRARALVALWLAVTVVTYVACDLVGHALPVIANRVLLMRNSAYFSIGAVAYLDFRDGRVARHTWALYALALVAAWLAQGVEGLVVATAMVLLFSLISQRRARLLDTRVLVFLGTISYPLYLLHQNIGYAVIHGLRAHSVGYPWAVLAAAAVSLAAATVLSFGVERPVRRWYSARRKQRRASEALAQA